MTDALNKVIVPIAIALLPIIWAAITWLFRRWQFRDLILREIQEIKPLTFEEVESRQEPGRRPAWTDHYRAGKKFVHTAILAEPSENRDFILSLPPSLVYAVNQLWQSMGSYRELCENSPAQGAETAPLRNCTTSGIAPSMGDADQWLYMLSKIRDQVPWWRVGQREGIGRVLIDWYDVIKDYDMQIDADTEQYIAWLKTEVAE